MPSLRLNTSRFAVSRFPIGRLATTALTLAAAALLLAEGGCERLRTVAQKVTSPAEAAPDYLAPPTPTGASVEANGAVRIEGTAPANATVSLRSPEGESAEAKADAAAKR